MPGKAINTSEVYFANVVTPNIAKGEEMQKQIDSLLESIKYINEVELPAIAQRRNNAQQYGNNAAYKDAQKDFRAAQERRDSLSRQRSDLIDQLEVLPTTNQLN